MTISLKRARCYWGAAVLLLPTLLVQAETTLSGQLQQEWLDWSSGEAGLSGWQLSDGGTHHDGAEESSLSHTDAGASELMVAHSQHLTNRYNGIGYASLGLNWQGEELWQRRELYLGLRSEQSLWRIGRLSSSYKDVTLSWDPFTATFMQARGNGGFSAHHLGYFDGAIRYDSNWWGIDLGAMVAIDRSDLNRNGEVDGNDSFSLSLRYPLKRWDLVLAYTDDQLRLQSQATKLALRWHYQKSTLTLQYEVMDQALAAGNDELWNGYLSYSYSAEAIQLSLALGRQLSKLGDDLDYYHLGIKFPLSKNFIVHSGYRVTRSSNSQTDLDESAYGLGLRILF
ncbi:porin [Ectothiorhodospiraceae bacterium BW-2]|nr:porin [Ectothiorhodospiraceae bacterium BW-2]